MRGAYKMYVIGDPFIKETPGQTFVKSVLLVVGLVPMFYGFMSLLHLGCDSDVTQRVPMSSYEFP